jgi:hypothetical protein
MQPGRAKATLSVGKALGFYYRASLLPVILTIIVGFFVGYFAGSLLGAVPGGIGIPFGAAAGAVAGLIAAVLGALFLLVAVPIGMLVDALIYQLFAKFVFGIWKGTYERTFTAVTYGMMPMLLFFWIAFIPFVDLLLIVIALWSLAVFIVSLGRQHRIGVWRAFGGVVLTWIAAIVITAAVRFALFLL